MTDELWRHGFVLVPSVLPAEEMHRLSETLGCVTGAGRRGLLADPAVASLSQSRALVDLVRPGLSGEPKAVRALYFDKAADSNWFVAWHQDLTLAVRERIEVAGFGPWSVKHGVPHVQAPAEVLEQMLAVRLHLDDADEANGALRVLAGTHRSGRLSSQQIDAMRGDGSGVVCCAAAGDALVMRPLLLHASSRSTISRRRRVLHIEYAACDLPGGLQWHDAA